MIIQEEQTPPIPINFVPVWVSNVQILSLAKST